MFNIKYRIPDEDREGLLFRQLRLSYCGHELDESSKCRGSSGQCNADHFRASNEHLRHCPNGSTLSDHGIKSHAVLHLVSTLGRNRTIKVECPNGARLIFSVSEFTKIFDLKMRLYVETGIALSRQRLIHNGNRLLDDALISDYNFTDGCTIYLFHGQGC